MSEVKHTPGPWSKKCERTGRDLIDIPLKAYQCERLGFAVVFVNGGREQEAEANAHLISAAPELLEACRKAEEWLDGWASAEPYVGILRAAIARATGEKQ